MATPLKFSIKMDRRDWIESMRRIGSTEIPQAVAWALDEPASGDIRSCGRLLGPKTSSGLDKVRLVEPT